MLSVEELNVADIRKLTSAYTTVAKRLGVILAIIGVAIAFVIAAYFVGEKPEWVTSGIMSVGVFLLALVICRSVALVKGDLDLIRLQAKLLVQEAQLRKARKLSEDIDESQSTSPFRKPPGYGGLVS